MTSALTAAHFGDARSESAPLAAASRADVRVAGRRSLRAQLVFDLGFLTSAAVLVVGLTTAVVAGGDLERTGLPLLALWVGSTVTFAWFGAHQIHRLVIRPLERLSAEADRLAAGELSANRPTHGSAELDSLAERYRALAEDLLDAQSHLVRVEKLAGIGRLAAGVAHEVRNPLGALNTYVEVLERRGAAPDVTAEMRVAAERIERTVQSLLDYAREGRPSGHTDLNDAVRSSLEFLGAQGMLREHVVALSLAPESPPVRGDRHALEQVVVNLVVNACQASPLGHLAIGTVLERYEPRHRATVRDGDGDGEMGAQRGRRWTPRPRRREIEPGTLGVLLYVADDGPGVPEGNRERIFDPFFTTKDPGVGTGLGLAIVARTVHDAGGLVWADQAREGGAVFKVFLPLAGTGDAHPDR